jgi:hypothetical protein
VDSQLAARWWAECCSCATLGENQLWPWLTFSSIYHVFSSLCPACIGHGKGPGSELWTHEGNLHQCPLVSSKHLGTRCTSPGWLWSFLIFGLARRCILCNQNPIAIFPTQFNFYSAWLTPNGGYELRLQWSTRLPTRITTKRATMSEEGKNSSKKPIWYLQTINHKWLLVLLLCFYRSNHGWQLGVQPLRIGPTVRLADWEVASATSTGWRTSRKSRGLFFSVCKFGQTFKNKRII